MAGSRKLTTSRVDRGRSLAEFLADRLPIDRAGADALVRGGAVYLDRHRIEDPDHLLGASHRLVVHLPAAGPPPPPPLPPPPPPPPPPRWPTGWCIRTPR